MNNGLRKYMKQLPYFLLFNYPKKMKTFMSLREKNRNIEDKADKIKLNAYYSPSPMNELCDYICTWEKKNILWNNNIDDLIDTRCLIINNDLDLSDKRIMKICRKYINNYAAYLRDVIFKDKAIRIETNSINKYCQELVIEQFVNDLKNELKLNDVLIANYVIKTSYNSLSISKSFAWL